MFGLMWVLLIRPQQRRVRLQRALVESLQAGDEIITSGGLCGTILSVDQEILVVELSPGVTVRMLRAAVQQRVGPDEDEDDGDDDGDADIPDDDVLDDLAPPQIDPPSGTTKPDGTP